MASRYQVLSQRLACRMRSVADAELSLSLFKVTAHRLFPEPQLMGNGSGFSPHGYQAQDRQLTTGQTGTEAAKSTSIRANKLFQAKGREVGGGADHYPAGLRQDRGKHLSRPEDHHPAAAHRARQAIAHSMFESELKGPSIDPNRLEHMLDLGPRIRSKTGPTQE